MSTDMPTKFDYLLNAFEQASQSARPSENGYAGKRAKLLSYVHALELSANRACVPVTGDMMSVGEDELREALRMLNSGRSYQYVAKRVFEAMIKAVPEPAGERVGAQREQTCVNCARPYTVEAIDFGICCICERDLIATRTGGAYWKKKLSAGRISMPSKEFAKRAVEITMECLLAGRISGYRADPVTITFQYSVDVVADKIIAELESADQPTAEPSARPADAQAGDGMCDCAGQCWSEVWPEYAARKHMRCRRIAAGLPFVEESAGKNK